MSRPRYILIVFTLLAGIGHYSAVAQEDDSQIAARVNGELIYVKEIDEAAHREIQRLNDQIQRVRLATLNRLIDNMLILQESRNQRISLEEFIARSLGSPSITEAEVNEAYSKSKDNFGGMLSAELRYRIKRGLDLKPV